MCATKARALSPKYDAQVLAYEYIRNANDTSHIRTSGKFRRVALSVVKKCID